MDASSPRSAAMLGRLDTLEGDFARWVTAFETRQTFSGPSIYFHDRAIARRRRHDDVESLLDDLCFLEYVYAVLPAWGMHRMGRQRAKVADFSGIRDGLRECLPELRALWPVTITALGEKDAVEAAATAWTVIDRLRVSTSGTQIVAGSKFLHHVLPDLVPPIDRQYTFRFFTGRKMVQNDRESFTEWLPRFAGIGGRCAPEILQAMRRGGPMATGQAKIIDNAIIGYMSTAGPR